MPTAITWRATPGASIPRFSTTACARTFSDLSQPRLPGVFRRRPGDLLEPAAPRTERGAAAGQLLLLRLCPSVVPDPDCHVDGDRLLRGERHGRLAATSPPVPVAERDLEFRDA